MIRDVLRMGDPRLFQKAVEVERFGTPELEELLADLRDTMAHLNGAGLAAPQIGVGARAFCMDVTGHPKTRSCAGLVVLLNPIIVAHEGSAVTREGCMSLPDFTGNVRRATEVTVHGTGPDGREQEITSDAFEARALQHEIDHLHGLLFLDRVSSLTADLFPRKRYR